MFNLSFRKKFIIAIIIIGALPVFVGLLITSYIGTRELRKSIGANFAGLAEQVAHKVDFLINNEISKMSLIVEEGGIKSYFQSGLNAEEYLHEKIFKGKNENYAVISLVDPQGKILASAGPQESLILSDISKKSEIEYYRLKDIFISDFYFQEKNKEYLFFISYPITDPKTKEFLGVVRVDYLRSFFGPAVEDIRFGETGHAMLIDSEGEIIICPILPTGEHILDLRFLKEIKEQKNGWLIADNDAHGGKNSIIGFHPIESVNQLRRKNNGLNTPVVSWYSFIRQAPEESYRPITLLSRYVFVSGLLLVILITLIGVVISKKLLQPLEVLRTGVEVIGKGNFDYRLNIETGDEFEELALEFNRMAEGLREAYLKSEQLAVLEEREWISREIHDRVAQNLAYVKMQMEIFNETNLSLSKEEIQYEMESLREIIKDTYDDLREIISGFRTKIEIASDFIPSLKNYLEKFSLRTETKINYKIEEGDFVIPLNMEVSFLRVIQEGLSNIRRHAQAKNVEIIVKKVNNNIIVIIEDDGIGFDLSKVSALKRQIGLEIMRERMEKLKGEFKIDSTIGKGTRLETSVPISE